MCGAAVHRLIQAIPRYHAVGVDRETRSLSPTILAKSRDSEAELVSNDQSHPPPIRGNLSLGLDVGVVQIDYLDRPGKATYDLLCHLNDNVDEADWSASSAGNTFVEYTRDTLLEQATEFASTNKLTPSEKDGLRSWIDSLPWKNDVIMLHLTW